MSPRRSIDHARQTRQAIVTVGVGVASVAGLETLSLGRLASETGLSKSGVAGHFDSKETLQLAVLAEAERIFRREVTVPAQRQPAGRPRLEAVAQNWISYLARDVFPGGCFFTGVSAEFDGRPGPVHDAIAAVNRNWRRYLADQIDHAVRQGEFAAETDTDQLVFELVGVMLSLNHALQLERDPTAAERARRSVARLLAGTPVSVTRGCQE